MDKLVSVIVPIFNSENYLQQCINSIITQTYKFLEIILVDDGSQDASGEICEKAKLYDSRIKVIHTNNHGVSIARNIGLEYSKGELILFCDADDYIHYDMIHIMVRTLQKNNCDLVICGRTNIKQESYKPIGLGYEGILKLEQCIQGVLCDDRILGSVCNKLLCRKLIGEVYFRPEITHCEDTFFLMEILIKKQVLTAFCIDRPMYYYRQSESSATNNVLKLFDEQSNLKYNNTYLKMLKKFQLSDNIQKIVQGKICSVSIYTLFRYNSILTYECRSKLLYYIKKYIYCYFSCSAFTKKAKCKSLLYFCGALIKLLGGIIRDGKDSIC